TCCQGLEIRITQAEYFRLAGMDCPKDLREKLDLSLHVLPHPDEYAYACLSPDFFGRCRMMDEKGLCALQCACGYEALTSVCKYFPRSPRLTRYPSCATSNACEETLELLFEEAEAGNAWTFAKVPLVFDLAGEAPKDTDPRSEETARFHEYAAWCMAGNALLLPEKFSLLRAIADGAKIPKEEETLSFAAAENSAHPLRVRKEVLSALLAKTGEDYPDLTQAAEGAAGILSSCDELLTEGDLARALAALSGAFPGVLPFLSFVLANELFYSGFPRSDGLAPKDAARVLPVFSFVLVLTLQGGLPTLHTREDLIDLTAAFFRMADLTPFWRRCHLALTKGPGDQNPDALSPSA
ncbi:MAG: hypothetical protein ACI4OJ_03835, partial [Lachnospiraceae bacterium]